MIRAAAAVFLLFLTYLLGSAGAAQNICGPVTINLSAGNCLSLDAPPGATYYVSPTGSDSNSGLSPAQAWQTVAKVSAATFGENDKVLLQGGASFSGCLSLTNPHIRSTSLAPLTIGSYGVGNFTLNANCIGNKQAAISIINVGAIVLQDCILVGNGGGAQYGVYIANNQIAPISSITVQRCDVSGFYAAAANDYGAEIFIAGFANAGAIDGVSILDNMLHGQATTSHDDNGFSSFSSGESITNLQISGNVVSNIGARAGAPNGTVGNGLIAGGANGVTIRENVVHDIGANTNTCGGPAGIWAFGSNNVTIEFNEIYNVKPASFVSGCDWNAFGLDAGVTNSVIQYNFSHDNYGSGYYLFAGNGNVGSWGSNTIRYNLSENDAFGNGDVTQGAITFYGQGSAGAGYIYNNTIWQGASVTGARIRPAGFATAGFSAPNGVFANNLIVALQNDLRDANFVSFNKMAPSGLVFRANGYFAPSGNPQWYLIGGSSSYRSLAAWQAVAPGGDIGAIMGDPKIVGAGGGVGVCGGYSASCAIAYQLQATSPLIGIGADLTTSPFGLSIGTQDFWGAPIVAPPSISAMH